MAIKSIKHRGVRQLWNKGSARGVPANSAGKLKRMLAAIDATSGPEALASATLPGWRLHPLKGDRAGVWSLSLTGNWRLLVRFDETGDAFDVDLKDYH